MYEEKIILRKKRASESIEKQADRFANQLSRHMVSPNQASKVKGAVFRILSNVQKGVISPERAEIQLSRIRNYVKTRSIEKTTQLEKKKMGDRAATFSGVRDALQRYGVTLTPSQSLKGKPHSEAKKQHIRSGMRVTVEKKRDELASSFLKVTMGGQKIPVRSAVGVSPHIYDAARNRAAIDLVTVMNRKGLSSDLIEDMLMYRMGYNRDNARKKIRIVLGI